MTRAFLLLALIPAASLYWQNRDIPHFGNLQDDAVYVSCGKAIATGQGYRLTHLPGQPYQVKYPPVYPLIVSALWRLNPAFPANLGTIVAWNLVPLAAIVIGLLRLYQKLGFSPNVAAALAFLVAALPAYIYLATSVMTEMTFIALFVWTFVLLEKDTAKWAAAAGLLAGLGYLTRTAAAPLLLTAPLVFALRRRFRPALAFIAAAAPLPFLWQAWSMQHKVSVSDWVSRFYLDYGAMERMTVGFDNLPIVVWENLDSILTNIGEIFVFNLGHGSEIGHQCSRLIAVAALAGCVRLARRSQRWQYPAFGAVFFVLMIFWHYPPDQRLFAPLSPLLVAGLWTELHNLWRMTAQTYARGKSGDRPVALAFGGAVCGFVAFVLFSLARARAIDLPAIEEASRADTNRQRLAFSRTTEIMPGDATVLSDQDVLLHLYTGRHAYRTIVPPRLFYPYQMALVRNAFAALPDSAASPWNYVYVSGGDWRHTMGPDESDALRKQIAQRKDLRAVWSDGADTLYMRKPNEDASVRRP